MDNMVEIKLMAEQWGSIIFKNVIYSLFLDSETRGCFTFKSYYTQKKIQCTI